MRTYCFVVQHPRASRADVDTPSGTLTVVRELIEHWGSDSRLIVLCNEDYANMRVLEQIRDEHGVQLDTSRVSTVEDRLARLRYLGDSVRLPTFRTVIIRLLSPLITVRAVLHLRKYLVDQSVDVVYSHSGGYPWSNLNLLTVFAARLAGIRNNFLISHNYSTPISWKRLLFSFVQDRLVGMAATRILSVSLATARSLEQQRHFGTGVGWIHNGTAVTRQSGGDGAPTPHWRAESSRVVMFLGSVVPRKGLDVLIKALACVGSDWRLVIYGSGPAEYVSSLKSLVEELDVPSRVCFAGFEPAASKQLAYCDVLVLPSVSYESFGMVILEAMYHRKPVICTDFGGMKEVVEHGRTGLVVPAGDVAELRDAIAALLDDPVRAREMGEQGYLRLLERFDVRRTVECYKRLVQ